MKKTLLFTAITAVCMVLVSVSCAKQVQPGDKSDINPFPDGALPGVFSVSATRQVYFSKGNLWYGKSGSSQTDTFNFEDNQYDSRGYDSANDAWGLFGWSISTNYGKDMSTNVNDYSGNFLDWGKAIDDKDTWHTLSSEEWKYLFNKDNAYGENIRSGKYKVGVTVCDKANCVVIAPDDFTDTIASSYNASSWSAAEAKGLVCLPPAGARIGSNIFDAKAFGYYWSSSANGDYAAYSVVCNSSSVEPESPSYRFCGYSVRLVTECK